MVKLTVGEKGRRLKWNLYFLGIVLVLVLGTCSILSRIDWSSFQRTAFEEYLFEREEAIVLMAMPGPSKPHKLLGECHASLRSRWLTGYFCDLTTGEFHFVGRAAPRNFRDAVGKQKKLIDAGKPFDQQAIPKLRMVVDFERLKCRLLVAEYELPT